MKINKEYIKQFNPCKDRWKNYLKHYSDFNGTVIEFLKLDKITWDDKKWLLFHEDQKLLSDKLLREFAIICASRVVDNADIEELNYFFMLNILMYESGENLTDDAAWDAAWYAAWDAAWYAVRYAAWDAARDVAWYAARDVAWYAARDVAWYVTGDAAWGKARDAARDAARGAEEAIQLQILINLIEANNE